MPVGRLIRTVRISDELPRLLNILKGDMTICGPRPERPEIAAQYEAAIPEFRLRLQAKAGLSWTEPIALRMEDDGRDTYTFFTHSQHSGKEMKWLDKWAWIWYNSIHRKIKCSILRN